ncbi:Carboxypeptidase S [Mycena venus]|uniref:Carboxypeptidase S n=1 Tax=Mycena venus TaxID=2733690 RepID=A0A8H7CUG7_9AGAR|nr:Carboxypeptidase S [Mycena venus]
MDSKSKSRADTLPGGAPPPPRRARWSFSYRNPSAAGVCTQESPLVPSKNGDLWNDLTALHATTEFRDRAVGQLSAAVQIPTETFDEMGPVGEDARWETRGPFVEHLKGGVPTCMKSRGLMDEWRRNEKLELQKVNTYGLIYTWQGSDASLKPLLLMGHYDVVPVAPLSVDQWTFPPYSGHFDGESVWGRGSSDDKSGVIGILTTIEVLLEKGFAPTRTIVLSFGFDEEGGGYQGLTDENIDMQGAGYLGPALLERFGPDSFAMIVDEGVGFTETFGGIFAAPGVAEKGSVNVNVEVQTPASLPPHTSIGILAALIVHLESNAPVPTLELGTPVFAMAQCIAAHAPEIPHKLKRAILRAPKSKRALKAAEEMLLTDKMFKALVGTTQAVDLISGGVKSNALPEQALALVNHRIATQSSVNATITRDAELTLEPAPITPNDAAPYALLAGTIRATFHAARKDVKDTEIFVAPGIMTGNTDTRFNWELSEHIFRYGHNDMTDLDGGLGGIHTVNEHMVANAFVEMITFFTTLILNADEAAL